MLGFGLGLTNCGIVGGVADAPDLGSGASALLAGEADGLALDFTDFSARVKDTGTPANNYNSSGQVSSGALVGCSGLLTYTSPSNKVTRQADGVMRYQAHNLILQSETLDNAYWTKTTITVTADADGTADLLTETGSGATFYNNAPNYVTVVNGGTYALKWRVKASANVQWVRVIAANNGSASQSVQRWFDIQNGVVGSSTGGSGWTYVDHTIADAGNGYYDCTLVFTTADTALSVWINSATADGSSTRGSSSSYYVARCHVYRYPANTDYIKTTTAAKYALPLEYDTSGNCLGLLVEEARTNLCLYSNDLTQAGSWTASNMTTAKTATGPDNVANSATTITATAGNATILQAITSTSAARVTSVYIKRRTGTGNIDLTQDNGSTWTTQAVTSTWTRFSLSSVTSANPTVGIRIVTSGDAVDVALFSHEVGSFPTSPIRTYGAAATRAADPLSQLATTFPLSATAGSFYAYVTPYAGADLAGIVSLNDGSGDEEIVIYKDASANIVAQVEDGGVGQLEPLDSTVNASSGTAFKVALAWAANDFALSADGTAAQTDTGGTLPTVTTLEIGVDQANNYFNGHIKAISFVPRRKSDAELQAETA